MSHMSCVVSKVTKLYIFDVVSTSWQTSFHIIDNHWARRQERPRASKVAPCTAQSLGADWPNEMDVTDVKLTKVEYEIEKGTIEML